MRYINRHYLSIYLSVCLSVYLSIYLSIYLQISYRKYSVLVDDKDAQHAESNRVTIQTAQKHIYLQHRHVYPIENFWNCETHNGNNLAALPQKKIYVILYKHGCVASKDALRQNIAIFCFKKL